MDATHAPLVNLLGPDRHVNTDTDRAWVDIDLGALVQNARSLIARMKAPLLPMVKANAYGLGAVAVTRALAAIEPWGFGVATVDEARELAENGVTRPVIVFTPLVPALVSSVAAVGARPAIGDLATLRAWLAHTRAPFHMEIDSGFSRSGFRWDDADTLGVARELVRDAEGLEGVYTHFHSAERDVAATELQWNRFQSVVHAFGRRPRLVHASSSAGGASDSKYAGDLVRPGIHLYGGRVPGLNAKPVAALRARVVATRRVFPGNTAGYDATWTATRPTTIATVAIGYADGVHRSLSNAGAVELLGTRVPIVGRVSMDHITVDAGDLRVSLGDVATLFGGLVTLDEQAALAGTISYELLTSLGMRVVRRYGNA